MVQVLTLEEIFAHAAKVARQTFNARGVIAPMWMGHTAIDELVSIMPEQFKTAEDKDQAVAAVRAIFKERGVVRYSFMTEAWILQSRDSSEAAVLRAAHAGKSLEHHPDRREVVAVQAEDKQRCLTGFYPILRPEHGKATLAPFKRNDAAEYSKGRMVGLLT